MYAVGALFRSAAGAGVPSADVAGQKLRTLGQEVSQQVVPKCSTLERGRQASNRTVHRD